MTLYERLEEAQDNLVRALEQNEKLQADLDDRDAQIRDGEAQVTSLREDLLGASKRIEELSASVTRLQEAAAATEAGIQGAVATGVAGVIAELGVGAVGAGNPANADAPPKNEELRGLDRVVAAFRAERVR